MTENGYNAKVKRPSEWVSSMVVFIRNRKTRICLDPGDLNKVIKREHYLWQTTANIAASVPDANAFSILDTKSGVKFRKQQLRLWELPGMRVWLFRLR